MMVKTLAPPRSRVLRLFAVVFGAVYVCSEAPASAQVIEIGSQGAVTVYDGPAVVTSDSVTAIRRPTLASRVRILATSAPPIRLAEAISDAAHASDLSEALIAAIAWRESRFRSEAVSRAGALGEMQLLPQTARQLGVDPKVSRQNIAGGAAYIRVLLQRYDGDLVKTLAAYNAGPGAVDRYHGVPPYKETRAYVASVLDRLSRESLDPDSWSQNGLDQDSLPHPNLHQIGRPPRTTLKSATEAYPVDLIVAGGIGR